MPVDCPLTNGPHAQIIESLFNARIDPDMPFIHEKPFIHKVASLKPRGASDFDIVGLLGMLSLAQYLRRPEAHLLQLRRAYADILSDTAKLRGYLDALLEASRTASPHLHDVKSYPKTLTISQLGGVYGMVCAAGLIVNAVLSCFEHPGNVLLPSDVEDMCQALLWLAEQMTEFRPVGAAYVPMCLATVWATSDDPCLQTEALKWIADYQRDTVGGDWDRQAVLLKNSLDQLRVDAALRGADTDPGPLNELALQAPAPGLCTVM
jgi:hypothetical protein